MFVLYLAVGREKKVVTLQYHFYYVELSDGCVFVFLSVGRKYFLIFNHLEDSLSASLCPQRILGTLQNCIC